MSLFISSPMNLFVLWICEKCLYFTVVSLFLYVYLQSKIINNITFRIAFRARFRSDIWCNFNTRKYLAQILTDRLNQIILTTRERSNAIHLQQWILSNVGLQERLQHVWSIELSVVINQCIHIQMSDVRCISLYFLRPDWRGCNRVDDCNSRRQRRATNCA